MKGPLEQLLECARFGLVLTENEINEASAELSRLRAEVEKAKETLLEHIREHQLTEEMGGIVARLEQEKDELRTQLAEARREIDGARVVIDQPGSEDGATIYDAAVASAGGHPTTGRLISETLAWARQHASVKFGEEGG